MGKDGTTITKGSRVTVTMGVVIIVAFFVIRYLYNQVENKASAAQTGLAVHAVEANRKFDDMIGVIQEQQLQNARTLSRMEATESNLNYHRAEDAVKSPADVREAMRD